FSPSATAVRRQKVKQPHIKLSRKSSKTVLHAPARGRAPRVSAAEPHWRDSKRIRIDTDAILELLAHAHYRRYVGLGDLSHRLLEGWLKRAERWRWLTLGCSSLRTTMWFVREFGWSWRPNQTFVWSQRRAMYRTRSPARCAHNPMWWSWTCGWRMGAGLKPPAKFIRGPPTAAC